MSIWDLRQLIESNTPWWAPVLAGFVLMVANIIYWFVHYD